MTVQKQEKPLYLGHRQRLKEKFLKDEGRSMPDYEILELLLTYAIPRKDVKTEAKMLIKEFGGLSEFIGASQERLLKSKRTLNQIALIKLVHTISVKLGLKHLKEVDHIVLRDIDSLADYCRRCVGTKEVEEFHVIFLDGSLRIIKDEIMQSGTVDEVAVYPREIAKKAIDYKAVQVVLYHNHPGGKLKPSDNDIKLTKEIAILLKSMDVDIADHLIITKNDMYSFKNAHILDMFDIELEKFYKNSMKPES